MPFAGPEMGSHAAAGNANEPRYQIFCDAARELRRLSGDEI